MTQLWRSHHVVLTEEFCQHYPSTGTTTHSQHHTHPLLFPYEGTAGGGLKEDTSIMVLLADKGLACVAVFSVSSWQEKAKAKGKSRERMEREQKEEREGGGSFSAPPPCH